MSDVEKTVTINQRYAIELEHLGGIHQWHADESAEVTAMLVTIFAWDRSAMKRRRVEHKVEKQTSSIITTIKLRSFKEWTDNV